MEETSRRKILKGVATLLADPTLKTAPTRSGKCYPMLMDVDKCFGCTACVVAGGSG